VRAPRVTVLMPVHDAAGFIGQALDSVRAQSLGDFECLVVDDGSTDGSAAIASGTGDPRVEVIRQAHLGMTRALNEGLARARGEYVARLDADDWSAPERLAWQTAFLDAHAKVTLVSTGIVLVDEAGRRLRKYLYPTSHDALARELRQGINPMPHSSIMFRREIVMKAGGYNEVFRISQDYDLYLRLLDRDEHRLAGIPEPLTYLRWTPNSLSHRGLEQRKEHLLARVAVEVRRTLGVDPTRGNDAGAFLAMFDAWYWASREVRYARATQLRRRAVVAFGGERRLDGAWLMAKSVALQPSWLWRGDPWDPAIADRVLSEWQRLAGKDAAGVWG
jgi:glycosyltransferase involved in cell wall biosynthesis